MQIKFHFSDVTYVQTNKTQVDDFLWGNNWVVSRLVRQFCKIKEDMVQTFKGKVIHYEFWIMVSGNIDPASEVFGEKKKGSFWQVLKDMNYILYWKKNTHT